MGQHWPRDSGGQPAFGDHFPNAFGRAFFEVNRHERIALAIFAEQPAEKRLRRRADVAESKFTLFAGGGAAHTLECFLEMLKQQRRLAQQHRARWSEADVMTCS